MTLGDFATLLDRDRLPDRLELVQTLPAWAGDEDWIRVRDQIDSLIFSQFLLRKPLSVRRIVFLEPPAGEQGRSAAEHRSWVSGLVRDLFFLGMPSQGAEAPYRIRQLVRDPRATGHQTLVSDGWSDQTNDSWSEAFESTWAVPGCIESNLTPPDYPVGPVGDRDPRWYLWH